MATRRKFSPGPWRVDRWREGYVGLPKRGIYAGGNSQPIAFATGTPRSSEVNDANVHLIIAAPDLLKELKRSGTHSRACAIKGVGGYPAGWIDGEAKQCTCSLGEVIAKAEGRDGP